MDIFESSEIHNSHELPELGRDAEEKRTRIQKYPNSCHDIALSVAGAQEPERVAATERRGILARFAIIDEMNDSRHYSTQSKWVITTVVAFAAVGGPMGTSILYR
jgi:hypothetical protein